MDNPLPVRKIIHLDMDAFYASVEQRDHPELRGLPIAVGGSRQRGVVAAASYEARHYGVRSAMASSIALRNCPELIFVQPRFEVYKAVSAQIRAIFAQYTPLIEPLSLDEAYLDVTQNLAAHHSATQTAQEIKAAIYEQTGLRASAGVSYNKFLAKLASDFRKPDGLFVIKPQQGLAFVEALRVEQFHGIGHVTARKMNDLGIFTGLDLRNQPLERLLRQFGKAGHYFYAIARAVDERPVNPSRERKSVGAETTFEQDLSEQGPLLDRLWPLLEKVWTHATANGLRARTVTLKLKYADFQQITRSQSLSAGLVQYAQLEQVSRQLVAGVMDLDRGIRLVGISLSNLVVSSPVTVQQLQLDLP